ncbi:MAG TPA: peptidoglycan-binding domain-containing protein [Candidatus Limiplasma sp.]|nr:peptidoglycan-binding domain-containing protein [Candidatus Limiplasma sp.]
MKKLLCLLLTLAVCLVPLAVLAQGAVPDTLPADLGGKTLYGYLMDLKNNYLPAKVFQDAAKYTDENRDNAKRAAVLIVDATTAKMEETGTPDQYMLYLRAYANDLLFQANGDAALQQAGLADYKQVVALGGTYAQADYDRLAAMEVQAGPLAWQMPQMLTLAEMAEILGVAEAELAFADVGYTTGDGSRTGVGYALQTAEDPAASVIYVLADPQGGQARYSVLQSEAVMHLTMAMGGIDDEALLMGFRNMDDNPALYTTLLVKKDELVLQVRVPYAFWSSAPYGINPAEPAQAIAHKVLSNLYDTQRTVPDMAGIVEKELIRSVEWNVSDAESPVPDGMPADLGGKTEYGYLVDMRQAYLPARVYANAELSDSDRNNARRAARLIAGSITKRFDSYGQNPYELEIRAACYRFAYLDTGEAVFQKLAINDYKQAISSGYTLGKSDYDALATPLLEPMAELALGASGDTVTLLQQWLIQAGFMDTQATGTFDEATKQAVELYESENSLTADGIADIAFLLSLYSRIDDLDVQLP